MSKQSAAAIPGYLVFFKELTMALEAVTRDTKRLHRQLVRIRFSGFTRSRNLTGFRHPFRRF